MNIGYMLLSAPALQEDGKHACYRRQHSKRDCDEHVPTYPRITERRREPKIEVRIERVGRPGPD